MGICNTPVLNLLATNRFSKHLIEFSEEIHIVVPDEIQDMQEWLAELLIKAHKLKRVSIHSLIRQTIITLYV